MSILASTKKAVTTAAVAYTLVLAARGWYYLGTDVKNYIAEKLASNKQ